MNKATAVIITGQARSFKHCYPTQRWGIYRKLRNPHFFVSVADDAQTESTYALRDHFEHVYIERHTQPTIPNELLVKARIASKHAPYGIRPADGHEGIWRQFWALQRGWQLFRERSAANHTNVTFTEIMRVRPDLHIHTFDRPRTSYLENAVFVPRWGSWGGTPDRMAYIRGMEAAAAYFNTVDRIEHLMSIGCPFHPETMLAASLELEMVVVSQTLDADFTSIRMDSEAHDPPVYSWRDIIRSVTAQ